jgi:hypothetical protein
VEHDIANLKALLTAAKALAEKLKDAVEELEDAECEGGEPLPASIREQLEECDELASDVCSCTCEW